MMPGNQRPQKTLQTYWRYMHIVRHHPAPKYHAFPSLSHVYHPKVRPLMEEFYRENGYPYRNLGWGEAIWKSYRVLWSPKAVQPSF